MIGQELPFNPHSPPPQIISSSPQGKMAASTWSEENAGSWAQRVSRFPEKNATEHAQKPIRCRPAQLTAHARKYRVFLTRPAFSTATYQDFGLFLTFLVPPQVVYLTAQSNLTCPNTLRGERVARGGSGAFLKLEHAHTASLILYGQPQPPFCEASLPSLSPSRLKDYPITLASLFRSSVQNLLSPHLPLTA